MSGFSGAFKTVTLAFILLNSSGLTAQQPVTASFPDSQHVKRLVPGNFCSNNIILAELRKDPAFKTREEKMNNEILNVTRTLSNDTLTLPVVVHIINSNPGSITDLQVMNGLKDLNDAFGKSGLYSASLGADTKIRFCLSQKDPDGGNTTGITRTKSFFSTHLNEDIEDRRLKNLVQWDPARYINIWLIASIDAEAYAIFSCGYWYRSGVAGYATMPPGGDPLDGIVVTGFGVLLAHEMGHYLGLYHTFDGGCYNYDCQLTGDRVCDTPPDRSMWSSGGCNSTYSSCDTDTLSNYSNGFFHTDVPDQITNFMDYGNNACSNQFTQGQADRMRAAITTQRTGLLQNECTKPCVENIIAGFTRDIAYPVSGDLITFTNTSSGAAGYQWLVNDVVVSTNAGFSYTFNATGKNKVTLKAFNTPACFAAYTDFVIVTCGVTARFYTDKKTIASKINISTDSIYFTNTSYNAQSYQWLMSNNQGMAEQVISTGTNLKYVFPYPANYHVRLIATNGACSDTTETYIVPVDDPTADGVPFRVTLTCYQQTKVKVNFCIADDGYVPLPKNTPFNFYDADPQLPGAHKLSPTFYLPFDVPGNCYACFTHVIDVPYHNLEKIFIVFNDAGNAIPVALPNTSLVESNYLNNTANTLPNKTTVYTAICQGQNYAGHTTPGTYTDTFTSIINGCDSIRTLYLTIKPVFNTSVTTSICQGQNYAGYTSSGTYVDVYSAVNGCDSTRTLYLTVKPTVSTTIAASICQGQNYAGHTSSGTYVDMYFAANGCDSTRTLHLTVKPTVSTTVTAFICRGQNYAGHTSSGTYVDVYSAVNGCDSTRMLYLTVKPTVSTTVTASICQGQNYAGHTSSGTWVDVYTAANGCDSTRTLKLTVNPVKYTSITASVCQGKNYAGHTTSGTYVDVYNTVFGCDSIRTLYLTIKPVVSTNIIATICEGTDYAGHTTPGTYIDVYTGANGCDSTRTLHLSVIAKKYTAASPVICEGEFYFAAGHFQTVTGIYRDTLSAYSGCDSVIITNLTVNPVPLPALGADRGICIGDILVLDPGNFAGYLWQNGSNDSTFTTNLVGKYSVTVTNTFGCKAADTMTLLKLYPLPADFLPADSSLCRDNIIRVHLSGYTNYNWSTGNAQDFINITQSGTYGLQVTDKNGCIGSDSMKVFFYTNCVLIQIPNAFTPDGNGKNEEFKPFIPVPVSNYHMQIWNRWGQQVFETRNVIKGWDGAFQSKIQPAGGYVYSITLKDINGVNVKRTGTLILIR
jgi:gliding motility-associated-like protein